MLNLSVFMFQIRITAHMIWQTASWRPPVETQPGLPPTVLAVKGSTSETPPVMVCSSVKQQSRFNSVGNTSALRVPRLDTSVNVHLVVNMHIVNMLYLLVFVNMIYKWFSKCPWHRHYLKQWEIRWVVHIVRMPDHRLSKILLYGDMQKGKHSPRGQKKALQRHI